MVGAVQKKPVLYGVILGVITLGGLIVLLSVLGVCVGGVLSPADVKITVLYTASLDGNLDGCNCGKEGNAGLVKRSAFLKKEYSEKPVLLVDTGNIFSPGEGPVLDRNILEVYEELGYHAVALGNQEFSDGFSRLLDFREQFPLVCHNVLVKKKNGKMIRITEQPYTVTVMDRRIGIVALLGKEVFSLYRKSFLENIAFLSPEKVLAEQKVRMQEIGTDAMILLYHGEEKGAEALAEQHPWVTAVFFGHENTYVERKTDNGVWLFSPGKNGNTIGKVVLRIKNGKKASLNKNISYVPKKDHHLTYADFSDDPTVRERIVRYEEHRDTILNQKNIDVLRTEIPLTYYYSPDCKKCTDFLNRKLPLLEKEFGVRFDLDKKDILEDGNFEEMMEVLDEHNVYGNSFPVLVIGDTIIQGENITTSAIEKAVRNRKEGGK